MHWDHLPGSWGAQSRALYPPWLSTSHWTHLCLGVLICIKKTNWSMHMFYSFGYDISPYNVILVRVLFLSLAIVLGLSSFFCLSPVLVWSFPPGGVFSTMSVLCLEEVLPVTLFHVLLFQKNWNSGTSHEVLKCPQGVSGEAKTLGCLIPHERELFLLLQLHRAQFVTEGLVDISFSSSCHLLLFFTTCTDLVPFEKHSPT